MATKKEYTYDDYMKAIKAQGFNSVDDYYNSDKFKSKDLKQQNAIKRYFSTGTTKVLKGNETTNQGLNAVKPVVKESPNTIKPIISDIDMAKIYAKYKDNVNDIYTKDSFKNKSAKDQAAIKNRISEYFNSMSKSQSPSKMDIVTNIAGETMSPAKDLKQDIKSRYNDVIANLKSNVDKLDPSLGNAFANRSAIIGEMFDLKSQALDSKNAVLQEKLDASTADFKSKYSGMWKNLKAIEDEFKASNSKIKEYIDSYHKDVEDAVNRKAAGSKAGVSGQLSAKGVDPTVIANTVGEIDSKYADELINEKNSYIEQLTKLQDGYTTFYRNLTQDQKTLTQDEKDFANEIYDKVKVIQDELVDAQKGYIADAFKGVTDYLDKSTEYAITDKVGAEDIQRELTLYKNYTDDMKISQLANKLESAGVAKANINADIMKEAIAKYPNNLDLALSYIADQTREVGIQDEIRKVAAQYEAAAKSEMAINAAATKASSAGKSSLSSGVNGVDGSDYTLAPGQTGDEVKNQGTVKRDATIVPEDKTTDTTSKLSPEQQAKIDKANSIGSIITDPDIIANVGKTPYAIQVTKKLAPKITSIVSNVAKSIKDYNTANRTSEQAFKAMNAAIIKAMNKASTSGGKGAKFAQYASKLISKIVSSGGSILSTSMPSFVKAGSKIGGVLTKLGKLAGPVAVGMGLWQLYEQIDKGEVTLTENDFANTARVTIKLVDNMLFDLIPDAITSNKWLKDDYDRNQEFLDENKKIKEHEDYIKNISIKDTTGNINNNSIGNKVDDKNNYNQGNASIGAGSTMSDNSNPIPSDSPKFKFQ